MRFSRFFIAIVIGTALAIGIFAGYRARLPSAAPTTATVLPQPLPLPEFELIDQFGNGIGPDAFRGRWDLVFFGFTNCPDVCPVTLTTLASARGRLAEARYEPLPRIVFISVDPERDTPDAVARYVAHFGDDVLGVTGELSELRRLTDALGIYFERVESGDGDYTVDHSAVVLVIDREGRFRAVFGSPHNVESFERDLPRIQAAG